MHYTGDRDDAPLDLLPARHLVADYKYERATVVDSHGCTGRCNFCALWKAARGKYHQRPLEAVVADIESVPGRRILLADDNTFEDVERVTQLAKMLRERGIDKEYQGYARTDTIAKYPDLFRQWRDLGLRELVVGVESDNDDDLRSVHKGNSIANNEAAARILQELGIRNWAHILLRADFTVSDYRRIGRFTERLGLRTPIFLPLTPLPGTDLYEQVKDDIAVTDLDYYNFEYPVMRLALPLCIVCDETRRLWFGAYSYWRYLRMALRGQLPWRALPWHLLVAWHMRRCVRKVLRKWALLEEASDGEG